MWGSATVTARLRLIRIGRFRFRRDDPDGKGGVRYTIGIAARTFRLHVSERHRRPLRVCFFLACSFGVTHCGSPLRIVTANLGLTGPICQFAPAGERTRPRLEIEATDECTRNNQIKTSRERNACLVFRQATAMGPRNRRRNLNSDLIGGVTLRRDNLRAHKRVFNYAAPLGAAEGAAAIAGEIRSNTSC